MNLLLLSHVGKTAGSTLSTVYLARGLVARGDRVWVAAPPATLLFSLLKRAGVRAVPLDFRGPFDFEAIRAIRNMVHGFGIELIDAQASRDRYCSILARYIYHLPVKLVHTRRQMPLSGGGRPQAWFYTRGTDRIVAVSHAVKRGLVRKGIPAGHVTVIHNGTPREKYDKVRGLSPGELRSSIGIDRKRFVIGCVSRRKKQEQLLRALQDVTVPCTVLFVGIERDDLLGAMAARVEPRHEVRFLGTVAPEESLRLHRLFDLHVLPSTMEGFSQALLESMALGTPVIATRAGGNPELITHTVNGFLFDDEDASNLASLIMSVAADPEKGRSQARQAEKTALEEFSIERTIDKHCMLFGELLGSPAVGEHCSPPQAAPGGAVPGAGSLLPHGAGPSVAEVVRAPARS